MERQYTLTDRLLMGLQRAAQAGAAAAGDAPPAPASPAAGLDEPELSAAERRHAAGLMRVNHAGEVAAQALYHGQARSARDPRLREHLLEAAAEEQAHLAWCEQRLAELGESPSKLQPLWYAGSYAIGAVAGLLGDRWSLGFVEETERQVVEHLESHLKRLPAADRRSRKVVEAMRSDEARHGRNAAEAGAAPLPVAVRQGMRAMARIMTGSAYWL